MVDWFYKWCEDEDIKRCVEILDRYDFSDKIVHGQNERRRMDVDCYYDMLKNADAIGTEEERQFIEDNFSWADFRDYMMYRYDGVFEYEHEAPIDLYFHNVKRKER